MSSAASDFLNDSVGPLQPNHPADVTTVQTLLNKQTFATKVSVAVNGKFDRETEKAIYTFQRKVLVMHHPDGIISPNGPTLRKLKTPSVATHLRRKAAQHSSNLAGMVSDAQFQAAANQLSSANARVEMAVIKAISINEAPRGPFDEQGRPNILFERHIFSNRTGGVWDKTHPGISNPVAEGPGEYGSYSAQYGRLAEAEALDHTEALNSASWGAFQIMGFNYDQAGYGTVGAFVAGMQSGVQAQLDSFVTFIKNDATLLRAVQQKDWYTFALHYNGNVGSKKHPRIRDNYDTRLKAAYEQIVREQQQAAPAPPVKTP